VAENMTKIDMKKLSGVSYREKCSVICVGDVDVMTKVGG
jgi:hypothetical protein